MVTGLTTPVELALAELADGDELAVAVRGVALGLRVAPPQPEIPANSRIAETRTRGARARGREVRQQPGLQIKCLKVVRV